LFLYFFDRISRGAPYLFVVFPLNERMIFTKFQKYKAFKPKNKKEVALNNVAISPGNERCLSTWLGLSTHLTKFFFELLLQVLMST
jgi:hypothetical protein